MASSSPLSATGRQSGGRAQLAETAPFSNDIHHENVTAANPNTKKPNNLKRTLSLAFLKKVGKVDVAVEATELASGERRCRDDDDDGKKARKSNSFKDSVVQSISKFKNRTRQNNSSETDSPLNTGNRTAGVTNAVLPSKPVVRVHVPQVMMDQLKNCTDEELSNLHQMVKRNIDNFLEIKKGSPEDNVVMSKAEYESLRQQLRDVKRWLKQKREEEEEEEEKEEEERKLHSSPVPKEVSNRRNSGHVQDEGVPFVEKKSKRQNAEPKAAGPNVVQYCFPGDTDCGADQLDGPVEKNDAHVEDLDEVVQAFEELQETSEEFEEIVEAVEEFEEIERNFEEKLKVEEEMQIKQKANGSFTNGWEFLEKEDIQEENVFVAPSTSHKVPIWDDTGVSSGWRHIGFVEEMEDAQTMD